MMINRHNNSKGFTLAELLVAMMVTSIILAAVATLAFAMGSVKDSTDDTSSKEAQLRYATLRLNDLIRDCKLICGAIGDDVAIWKADDNGDKKINASELVYIEAGASRNYIKLLESTSTSSSVILLSDINSGSAKMTLLGGGYRRTDIVPVCSDVKFGPTISPLSKSMWISFNVVENGASCPRQISGNLRGWAGNLLNSSATAIVNDDD